MLKKWGLTNFKSIYNMEKDMEFAPLTVLTGTNSSGKSSFIQSILLIAQTMQNKFFDRSLVLNGDFVDLGQFDDIRSRPRSDSKHEYLPVGIRWSYKCVGNIEKEDYILNIEDKSKQLYELYEINEFEKEFLDAPPEEKDDEYGEWFTISKKEYVINFDLEFDSFHSKEENIKLYQKEQFLPRIISVKQNILNLEEGNDKLPHTLYAKEDSQINIDKIINEQSDKEKYCYLLADTDPVFHISHYTCPVRVVHFWPGVIYVSSKNLGLKNFESETFTYNYFEACYREFGNIFSKFKYLGPLRFRDSYYPFSKAADPKDVGVNGEYTAAVLDVYKDENISFIPPDYLYNNASDKMNFIEKPLIEALKDWLHYLDMANEIETEVTKHGYELKYNFINVSHVGTGVSQVLPILVSCLLAEKGATLIFEQPELHLHPRVQSKLADFFLSITLLGKQCIIETHSEYFIDKLRLRICQSLLDKNEEIKKNTKIYYFDNDGIETKIKEIEVNEYGDYSIWPDGFFDERQHNSKEMLKSIDEKMFKETAGEDSETSDD